MSVAHWPESLPPVLRAPFNASRMEGRRRKSSEGVPAYKRRFSRTALRVVLGIEATAAQRAVFHAFFDDDTAGGSLPFVLPDPTLDGQRLLTGSGDVLLHSNGQPLLIAANWLCLFGDELPQEQIVGGRFAITFSVWVLP